MPEILEVEASRRLLGERALRRRITAVDAPDPWYLKGGLTAEVLTNVLVGRRFGAVRRRGKLLLLDVERGPTLGLHFGMTGRVYVDGLAALEKLRWGSNRPEARWDRFVVRFGARGVLLVRDPRRLGGVELEPDEERLGPDALSLTREQLGAALDARRAPLKAVLLDQRRIAGLGNLLVDDALWWAGLDPARVAGGLDAAERATLHRAIRRTLRVLGRRGGSHTGELQAVRDHGGVCPRDATPLLRRQVGGRTTYSCPQHQR